MLPCCHHRPAAQPVAGAGGRPPPCPWPLRVSVTLLCSAPGAGFHLGCSGAPPKCRLCTSRCSRSQPWSPTVHLSGFPSYLTPPRPTPMPQFPQQQDSVITATALLAGGLEEPTDIKGTEGSWHARESGDYRSSVSSQRRCCLRNRGSERQNHLLEVTGLAVAVAEPGLEPRKVRDQVQAAGLRSSTLGGPAPASSAPPPCCALTHGGDPKDLLPLPAPSTE